MEWYKFYWEWFRMVFIMPLAIAQTIAFILVLISNYIKRKRPTWSNLLKTKIPLISLIILLLAGFFIAPYKIYINKKVDISNGFKNPDALLGSRLEGIDFRIVDLAREDLIVKNRTIINCRIYGPAVLYPVECTFRNINFSSTSKNLEDNLSSIFIHIPETSIIQGVIKVENIDFRDCTFNKIAFIGTDQLKKDMLSGISNSN